MARPVSYTIKTDGVTTVAAAHINQVQADVVLLDAAVATLEAAASVGSAYVVNLLITDYLVATAGRTFPTNASIKPDGTSFTPTIAAVTGGSDTYKVTFTPTTTGAWLFDVTDSIGERWTATYQVRAA